MGNLSLIYAEYGILSRNFDFNLRRDPEKICYERRDYDSVDDNETTQGFIPKTYEKRIRQVEG